MVNIKYLKYLLFFLMLLCILFGILGYFSNLYDTEKENNTNNEEEEQTEADENLVSFLYESIKVFEDESRSNNDIDYYTNNIITNNTKLRIGIKNLDLSINGDYSQTIKASDIEGKIKEMFGESVTFTHENVTYDCVNYIYDKSKELYTIEDSKCGNRSSSYYYSQFDKAYMENGDIIIEEKVLYEEGILSNKNILTTVYVYTLNKESQIGLESSGTYELNIETYKNTASTVKYLFVKSSDGNYYFANVLK